MSPGDTGHRHTATGRAPAPVPKGCSQPEPWALTIGTADTALAQPTQPGAHIPRDAGCAAGIPGASIAGRVNRYEIKPFAGLTGCHRGPSWTIKWLSDRLVKLFWGKGAFYNLD